MTDPKMVNSFSKIIFPPPSAAEEAFSAGSSQKQFPWASQAVNIYLSH
jgi:hypothetical protein